MNAAKAVQILLVVVLVLYVLSVAVGVRGDRDTAERVPDDFEPPAWLANLGQRIEAPHPPVELSELEFADGAPVEDHRIRVAQPTTLRVLPGETRVRRARFTLSGSSVSITYQPAPDDPDVGTEEVSQQWPRDWSDNEPVSFTVPRNGAWIVFRPLGPDSLTTATLEQ